MEPTVSVNLADMDQYRLCLSKDGGTTWLAQNAELTIRSCFFCSTTPLSFSCTVLYDVCVCLYVLFWLLF